MQQQRRRQQRGMKHDIRLQPGIKAHRRHRVLLNRWVEATRLVGHEVRVDQPDGHEMSKCLVYLCFSHGLFHKLHDQYGDKSPCPSTTAFVGAKDAQLKRRRWLHGYHRSRGVGLPSLSRSGTTSPDYRPESSKMQRAKLRLHAKEGFH